VIRAIVAADERLGLATDKGIPWNVPADKKYFRAKTAGGIVVMGLATYVDFAQPLPDAANFVATEHSAELRPGFMATGDVEGFLDSDHDREVWIIGGARLFQSTLDYVQQIYLTRVEGDFGCTKFFPEFQESFDLASDESSPVVVDTPSIRFQIWQRTTSATGG